MKNRISKFAAWRAAFLFAALTTSGAAHAYVVTFGDSVKYWAGFPSSVNGQNDQDVIGTPNILGGSVEVGTDGFIDTISITHKKTAGGSAPDLGDLFLDVGNDGDWDFVVDLATRIGYVDTRLNTGTLLSFADGAFPIGNGDLSAYTDGSEHWGSGFREDHPVGVSESMADQGSVLGDIAISNGSFFDKKRDPIIFDFAGNDWLQVAGQHLTIGFGASCANDVIFETVFIPLQSTFEDRPSQVPEPAAPLLFGLGLLSLLWVSRARKVVR